MLFSILKAIIVEKDKEETAMNTQSLSEIVVENIKNAIFKDQTWKPGDQLPIEQELVDQMQVSRTALREGIKKLETEGILVIKRGVGTFVSEDFGLGIHPNGLSYEELQRKLLTQWYEARLVWEVHSMPLVAQNASDTELAEIEEIQAEIDRLIDSNDDFYNMDFLFHKKLAACTHNNILKKAIDSSSIWEWSYYTIARQRVNLQPFMRQNSHNGHTQIIEFLKLRDGEGAEMAMRHHLITAINDLNK